MCCPSLNNILGQIVMWCLSCAVYRQEVDDLVTAAVAVAAARAQAAADSAADTAGAAAAGEADIATALTAVCQVATNALEVGHLANFFRGIKRHKMSLMCSHQGFVLTRVITSDIEQSNFHSKACPNKTACQCTTVKHARQASRGVCS